MQCSQCSLNAKYLCKSCKTQPYCGKACAQWDWVQSHYQLCEGETKKRDREEDEYWQCPGHPEWLFERKPLGEGTYGYVLVACQNQGCNYVAKVFKFPQEESDAYVTEVRLMKRLNASRISPKLLDYFECPERGDILIMEKLEGTLEQMVLSKSPQNYRMVIYNVALLVAKLHQDYDIAHRDLSPRNIMYKGERWYIIDFGLAVERAKLDDRLRDIELLAKIATFVLPRADILRIFKAVFPEHEPFTRPDLARSAPPSFYETSPPPEVA